jgi:hypothetical protein
MRILPYFMSLAVIAPAVAGPTISNTVVLSRGERIAYRTAAPIAIVSLQGGAKPKSAPFRFEPEQYAQTIGITGLREGEATLLVEDTTEHVGEMVRVVVVPKNLETAYHQVSEQFAAGTGGIGPPDVLIAPPNVVITGTAFSLAEMGRCVDAEKSPSVICAARLASVAAVVGQNSIPQARASVSVERQSSTSPSTPTEWRTILRIGDVPVVALQSGNFTSSVARSATAAHTLNRALAGWAKNAESNLTFPATFAVQNIAGRYEFGIQWNQTQGARGENFLDIQSSELLASEVGADSGRILDWHLAVFTDAFRLYTLARPPLRTAGRSENGLQRLYSTALKVGNGDLTRTNCAQALARSFVSLQWSGGSDPLATLLTRIPDDFQRTSR